MPNAHAHNHFLVIATMTTAEQKLALTLGLTAGTAIVQEKYRYPDTYQTRKSSDKLQGTIRTITHVN